ncbi:MAG: type II toxin-antitoxin system RelE/ParE family toxin [Mariniphaga sp.]|nr:type II toxin-antitoxin system RelE/ParE family toxin [Mariniphaga sp.]
MIELIKSLSENSIPGSAQKMSGFENVYRVRSGVYRVVYSIDKEVLVIEIIKIAHRQNIFK